MLYKLKEQTAPGGPLHASTADAGVAAQTRSSRRLSILLLCDDNRGHANTVLDHIAMFTKYSSHDVRRFNPRRLVRSRSLDLDEFDVIVLHYSLVIISDDYLAPSFREQLRRFAGLKVQFIQDECRWVDAITAMMRHLGIHVLFTLLPDPDRAKVYNPTSLPGVTIHRTLAGYVSEELVGLPTPPSESRPIDIGYRGRTLPYWLGELTQEKVWIGQGVLARGRGYGLNMDIDWSEESRIYGTRWNRFLSSCKATLGTESGASITDFDGSIEKMTKDYLAGHPRADFAEVQRAVLQPYEGNVRMNQVSPRVFEAAAMRTALILFPGDYSGVVQPWIHYIPLAKDFSNFGEVVERLRDHTFLRAMTERTYADLIASGRYSGMAFAREFDAIMEKHGRPHGRRTKRRYRAAMVERSLTIASLRVKEFLNPVTKFAANLAKASAALRWLVRSRAGRMILYHHMAEGDMSLAQRIRHPLRQMYRLHRLLNDVLRLTLIGRALHGINMDSKPLAISLRFDRGHSQLQFISERRAASAPPDGLWRSGWHEIDTALQAGAVRSMVWNHAAVGGEVRYLLTRSKGPAVCVGEHDVHHFGAMERLVHRYPHLVREFLTAILFPTPAVPRRLHMSDGVIIDDVRKFWEAHPVAAASVPFPLGSEEYFRCYDGLREANESLEFSCMLHEYARFNGKKVLDVGCGNGYVLSKYAAEGAEVVGVDLTGTSIDLCRKRFALSGLSGQFAVGNAESLPYPDKTFDCVCSMGVLHHTPDMPRAIGELYRVLKPGGRLILMLYHRNSANYRVNMLVHHVRTGRSMDEMARAVDGIGNPKGAVYSKSDVRRLLRRFVDVECFAGHLTREMLPKVGRVLPESWLHLFERRWGWFLYAKAVKLS